MSEDNFTYDVRCKTCRTVFKVQLFENHEKNLFLVDKKDWYCAACRKEFGRQQTAKLSQAHRDIGLPDPGDVTNYRAAVPADFAFSVKAPNSLTLTHVYRKTKNEPLVANPYPIALAAAYRATTFQ